MKKFFVLAALVMIGGLLFIGGSSASEKLNINFQSDAIEVKTDEAVETRCGWFANPTPANAWLNDKDGEWIIGVQGGYQAEGDYPSFKKSQWVKTNVNYGYGCACIKGTFNKQTQQVISIKSSVAKPLSACKKDKALKRPE